MKKIDIDYIHINNTRYKTKLYIEAQGYPVDEDYSFSIPLGGEMKKVLIKHFGYIEVDGVNYSLVGFLEKHFRQKKPIIIRNIAKCFGLKKML